MKIEEIIIVSEMAKLKNIRKRRQIRRNYKVFGIKKK